MMTADFGLFIAGFGLGALTTLCGAALVIMYIVTWAAYYYGMGNKPQPQQESTSDRRARLDAEFREAAGRG